MGFFDFIGREPKAKTTERHTSTREFDNLTTENQTDKRAPIAIFSPTSYDDVAVIIDSLKQGKSAIVHFEELKPDTAIRVLDMLSGAIYALNGGVYEMQKNTFMFSPTGIELL